MNIKGIVLHRATAAPMSKEAWNAAHDGIAKPSAAATVWEVRIAARTAPAAVIPVTRMRLFTPRPDPASLAGTLPRIKAGNAANASADPVSASMETMVSCQGVEDNQIPEMYPVAVVMAPAIAVARGPIRFSRRADTGAMNSKQHVSRHTSRGFGSTSTTNWSSCRRCAG